MATINGSTNHTYWDFKLEVTETSTSTANNTSTIQVDAYIGRIGSASYLTGAKIPVTVKCTGVSNKTFTYSNSGRVDVAAGAWLKIGGVTFTGVPHNSDGSKTVTISASFTNNVNPTSGSASGSLKLTDIPRKSSLTASNGTLGTAQTLTISRASSSFTHTITYKCGTASGTITTKTTSTSISWTPPLSLSSQNTTGTTVSVVFTLTTYTGSTSLGSNTKTITCSLPSSVKPTASIQVLDATDYKDTYGNLIKGLSKLYVKVTATQSYGSAIVSYNTTANGMTYTTAEFTTDVLAEAGTTTVSANVTDKRGRTSSAASASFPVIDYNPPAVTALSVHRCDADGTENDQGGYIQTTFSASVTPLNDLNSASYTLRYKRTDVSNYTTYVFTDLAGNYSVTSQSYIFEASSDYSYDVEIVVTDDIGTTTRATSASTAFSLMDWNANGTGIAFGKVSEKSNTFENAMDLNQLGNQYCFGTNAGNVMGYVALARIEITSVYANAPITFELGHRSSPSTMTVHVRFYNEENLTPPLDTIVYEGDNYGAFLVNDAQSAGETAPGSTWTLYVGKQYSNDWITLQRWTAPTCMNGRFKLTFPGNAVSSVPEPFYRATPAKLRSILDYVYPVGTIYMTVSPDLDTAEKMSSYFGGTWVAWGRGRVPIGVHPDDTDFNTVEKSGGAKTSSHYHWQTIADDGTNGYVTTTGASGNSRVITASRHTFSVVNKATSAARQDATYSSSPSVVQPYVTCYMWKRTA